MAIVYNSTSLINEQTGSSSTLTWSHTCNSLDTKLIVAVGGRDSISGVTYNGVSMTLLDSHFDTYQYNAYYYLDNPSVGSAYNIVATYSSSNVSRTGISVGLSGASTGVGASGTKDSNFTGTVPKTITSSVTTTLDNSHILTIPSANQYEDTGAWNLAYGSNQTEITRNTAINWSFRVQYKVKTTAGSDTTTIGCTSGSALNIMIYSFELKTQLSGPANLKSYNTNLKANIKSINTNLIANVKSLNTNV